MANGKVCPACGKDIGVWAIFAAGGPSRIRCPHCRARLRYDGAVRIVVLPFAIVAVAALVGHEAAVDLGMVRPGLLIAFLALLTWVPIELLLAIYLRDHRTLRLVEPRPTPPRQAP
jgi:DNA-directed RNA polymerase subunit RPC12/RpoP